MYITMALISMVITVRNFPITGAEQQVRDEDKTTVATTTAPLLLPKVDRGYLFFEIHTANEQGAGTDSNIYVTIFGTKTNLTRQALRSIGPSMNAFERNQVDVCLLYTTVKFDTTENIIQGIQLINDGKWAGSSWKPSCIYLSGVNGAQTNDRWVSSGSPLYISFAESNRDVCYE